MIPPRFVSPVVLLLAVAAPILPLTSFSAEGDPKPFSEKLEELRAAASLPALGGAASIDGQVVEIATTGVRRLGGKSNVTNNDLWHIGSITKSMTSTLAGVLVDQGKIKWDATVKDILGPAVRIEPQWETVTLSQLLQHRGGAPGDAPPKLWAEAWRRAGSPRQQRMDFVRGLLAMAPAHPPGREYHYSNQGYSIAGAMLERVTNQSWEDLLKKHVFVPLGMTSAGFGPPGKAGRDNQPLGHQGKTSMKPIEVGPQADNPAAIGPGGTVHCSLTDLVRYAQWHADGPEGAAKLQMKPGTFTRLHQPPENGTYAMGWNVTERPWANGTALMHNGSNTMWFAVIWLSPAKKAAFAAVTNAASEGAAKACDSTVAELIQRHLK